MSESASEKAAPGKRPELSQQQRRRLVVLSGVFSATLLTLMSFSVPNYPALPSPYPTLTASPPGTQWAALATPGSADPATGMPADPTRRFFSSTPGLGEAPGPTSTPTAYFAFLPSLDHFPVTPFVVELVPEPPPVQPTPDWPPGLDTQTASKLGLHVVRNSDPFIMEFIRRVRPRVIKAVDDLGWLADVKAVSPNTITIGRINGQDESGVLTVDPAAAADAYIAAHLAAYRGNTGVDFWEGWNEFVPQTAERMRWYAAFEARRVCAMQGLGLRAAVGGFSVGTPEWDQMAMFLPALQAAYRCGGIFTLHEYNSPTLDCGIATSYAGAIPGAPDLGDMLVGAYSLRYRFWYDGYLKPRGMGNLPLVISELGVESRPAAQRACGDAGGHAWKSYSDEWGGAQDAFNAGQAYVQTLAWYDAQIRQDEYVLGATVFTAGALGPGDGWYPYDIHEAIIPLAYYAVEQR